MISKLISRFDHTTDIFSRAKLLSLSCSGTYPIYRGKFKNLLYYLIRCDVYIRVNYGPSNLQKWIQHTRISWVGYLKIENTKSEKYDSLVFD